MKNNSPVTIGEKVALHIHSGKPHHEIDNLKLWAGNLVIDVGGAVLGAPLARVYLDSAAGEKLTARVFVELYVEGADALTPPTDGEVDARLWLDFNNHGFHDERGVHHPALPRYEKMSLLLDEDGHPAMRGNNFVFASETLEITATGVFNFTVAFSADGKPRADLSKEWVTVNEIAHNRDGVLVVTDSKIADCPSITEVCLRKYGASIENGAFKSGGVRALIDDIENIVTEVIYVLPFFETGVMDIDTGADVRKGTLGSIYAVKDFFKIAPEIVTPPEEADVPALAEAGLVTDRDLAEILTGRQQAEIPTVAELARLEQADVARIVDRDTLVQLIGHAEMRALTNKAHALGKRVIFDLVLMQTSRDCPLIREHPRWYCLDENGRPKKHRIAWLDYSDVALFDLVFNKELQNYLGGVAPYWITECGFDGVRIDASQTVDRPFLKQIKNRICEVKPDALVLCETLCPMSEAADVPGDVIYTLLVDHHVHVENANSYFNLFQTIHGSFTPGTTGMAYFENHDSVRATREWHVRYSSMIDADEAARKYWTPLAAKALGAAPANTWEAAYYPALLKNILCSLINHTAGSWSGVRFAWAVEFGAEYGEEQRTDFENETVLFTHLRARPPHNLLFNAYRALAALKDSHPALHRGGVYYLWNGCPGTDPADRLMAYVKHTPGSARLVAINLDPAATRKGSYHLNFLDIDPAKRYALETVFDTRELMGAGKTPPLKAMSGREILRDGVTIGLPPLGAIVVKIY